MSNGDERSSHFKGSEDINISRGGASRRGVEGERRTEDRYISSDSKRSFYANPYYDERSNYSSERRDIYSDSSKERSLEKSSGDVYIGKKPSSGSAAGGDVYFSKKSHRYDTEEFIIDVSSGRASQRTDEQPVRRSGAVRVYDEQPEEIYSNTPKNEKPKKKKHKGAKIFAGVVAVVLAVTVMLGAWGYSSVMSAFDALIPADEIVHAQTETPLTAVEGVTNILLIGADKEKYGAQRSDTIMIASVNKNSGKITLTSILRDSYVDIPGEGYSKINASYVWGGANLLIQTIELNFGIKIDEYCVVDFDMFTALIDALGGIDVKITEEEADFLNNGQDYKKNPKPDEFTSGESVHINGYQALWFSRIRYLDTDFMRTGRQRRVITSIIKSVKSKLTPAGIPSLVKTAKEVAPYVKTTVTRDELFSLGTDALSCLMNAGDGLDNMLVSQKIPFDGTWYYDTIYGEDVVVVDVEENARLLYQSVYEPQTLEPQAAEEE